MSTGSPAHRVLLFALAALGCGLPNVDVKAPEPQLPAAYAAETAGPSAANLSWREYFADERLNSLISSALENNLDLRITLQRIEIARAGVRQATGAILPQVALAVGGGVRKFGLYTMDGAGNATTDITPGQLIPVHLPDFSVGLQSTWEVDVWAKLRNQRDAATARYLATVEGTSFVITSLIADVASAYFELVALDHMLDVLRQTVARQEEALEIVRLQKEVGRANELAVQQFEAQLASTRAMEVATLQRSQVLENQVNLLLGRAPQPLARSKGELALDVAANVSAGVPSDLLKNRPDVREAEREVQATQWDLKAARAAFFPSLTLSAGVGYQAFNPRFLFSTPDSVAYSAFAGLVAPLVNRAGIEAEFDTAKAYQVQAMYNYQRVVLNAFVEVVNGLTVAERASEVLALRRAQRAAVLGTVEAADTLYRAGKATYFEVLMAQQNTLAAELELVEATREQRLASVGVYKALGGGWQ